MYLLGIHVKKEMEYNVVCLDIRRSGRSGVG